MGKFLLNLLIIDQNTGKYSHSKFFACIAYIALTIAFFNVMTNLDAWVIYGGLVLGSHIGNRITNDKTGISLNKKK